MPGDAAGAMPGAQLPCGVVSSTPGTARCTIAINLNVAALAAEIVAPAAIPGYHPDDIQARYGLPAHNAGGTVAIVDAYDAPLAEADLAVYRAAFGLPPCTSANGCFRKLNQSGTAGWYPLANLAWAQEIALDLEMVSAACPRCSLVLVEANSAQVDDLGAAVDTAATLNPAAISNSYYAPEWPAETAEDVHYQHPGIAITASAGDTPSPSYPATSPHVVAIGGTTDHGGRGCSAYEAKPSWQTTSACSTRNAVDVAALADPQTGVAMYATTSGGWVVAGGTSVGAPLIAAAHALSGNPAVPGWAYAHADAFTHIAPTGYDVVTGFGTPHGVGGV
jgi:subtilase family serine protease